MSKYKKLEVNGILLFYKQYWCGHPDESELYTKFYTLEKVPEKKWSWIRFRKIRTGRVVDDFVERFELSLDIENPNYTKGQIRKKIEHQVELMGRTEELNRGEII